MSTAPQASRDVSGQMDMGWFHNLSYVIDVRH